MPAPAPKRRKWHSASRCYSSSSSSSSASAATTDPQQQAGAAASLVEWARSIGQVDPALHVVSTPDQGLGLVAGDDLEPGQRLVLLPAEAQLTFNETTSDPKILALIQQVPAELWGARLAIQLLLERVKGKASPFAAYVEQLPLRVPVPIFFDKAGIDAIQYPPVSEQVKKRCRWLYDFSTKVLAGLPNTPADPFGGVKVDINALGWAMACVSSRAFRVRGPAHPAAMLPLIDMANHSSDGANCEVLPVAQQHHGKNAIGMFAKRKVSKGEPLLLSYGDLSNDFLFMDYAFTVPGNPHDRVTLRWDLDLLEAAADLGKARVPEGTFAGGGAGNGPAGTCSHLPPWKRRWLTQAKLLGPGSNLEVGVGGPQLADARLLAALRVLLATSEAEVQGRGDARLGDLAAPLSRQSETAVLRVLAGMATVALASFPTTLEQDKQLLGGGEPPVSVQQAVGFRMHKKETLVAALQGIQRRLQELQEDTSLPASTAPPSALSKGKKPQSATTTTKGFGGGGGGGGGKKN